MDSKASLDIVSESRTDIDRTPSVDMDREQVKRDVTYALCGAVALGVIGFVIGSSYGVVSGGWGASGAWFGAVFCAIIGGLLGYVVSIRRGTNTKKRERP